MFNKNWVWLDVLVLMLITISIVSSILLAINLFAPKQAILLGLTIGTVAFYFMKKNSVSITDADEIGLLPLIAVILFAAVFRLEPYPWINGGQDQGIYVSMSSHYQHGGSIFIEDPILEKITEHDLKDTYQNNLPEKIFQPGVYYGGAADYVFQFYHLHPLWMAIFAETFGDNARIYSLTFFSLLSILFLSLLTFELSSSRTAALSVGILLAVNPLHAFFSKWPVTEVVALAFSAIAFYYLARSWRLKESLKHARWALIISCLSLSMLFFVRISGFLYLPLLFFIFITGVWLHQIRGERFGKDLIIYSLACVGLYVLSVLYGLWFSPNYSADIYRLTFGKFANVHWAIVMSTMLGCKLFAMYVWRSHFCQIKYSQKLLIWLNPVTVMKALILITGAAITFSLIQVYRLGYTDAFDSHQWLGIMWELSNTGMAAVERATVLNLFIYSSPFLIIAAIFALWRKGADHRIVLLMIVPLTALTLFVLTNPVIPYQYYYARYLVSEVVPYFIVISVVVMIGSDSNFWRRAGILTVALSILWFSYFTVKQFGAEEGVRPLSTLRQLDIHIDEDDVLLVEPTGWNIPPMALQTPLRFYFGLMTFALPAEERELHRRQIANSFRKVWLLSPKPIDDDYFVLSERLLHYDKVVERSGHVPLGVNDNYWHQPLYLYEMKKKGWPSGEGESLSLESGRYPVSYNNPDIATLLGEGWHNIEQNQVWSSGKAQLNIDKEMFQTKRLPDIVTLEIEPFAASRERMVSLQINSCGDHDRKYSFQTNEKVHVHIPITKTKNRIRCDAVLKIENAVSPLDLGVSTDSRQLGVALHSITFEYSQ